MNKYILLFLLLAIASVNLLSQTYEPRPIPFVWGTDPNPRIFDTTASQFK